MTHLDLRQQKASLIHTVIEGEDALVAGKEEEEEAMISTTSKHAVDEGWLQLGLSSCLSKLTDAPTNHSGNRGELRPAVELNLFSIRPSTHLQPLSKKVHSASVMDLRESSWGFSATEKSIPSITTALPPPVVMGSKVWQFGCPSEHPGDEMRVVRPPPRPQIGVWFELRTSQNQLKEVLPQVLKSYLRIKDGRMTVSLVMKYLANKLGLDDEQEVEITCRGLQLPPFLTLQHVRDRIWCSRDAGLTQQDSLNTGASLSLLGSPDIRPLMILKYNRKAWYGVRLS